MPSIEVPQGYSYVLAAATSTMFLNAWQLFKVNGARKQAGIQYPQLYAEKTEAAASKQALIFNCIQRAHQNTLESTPHVLLAVLVTGLKYPLVAAGLGGTWVVGRVLYTIGYSTGDPGKRSYGSVGSLGMLAPGLILSSAYTVYEFVAEGL
ncbi:hypothetical protein M0805_007141 [Coniferiporia weirii]|nr:hypothetical protein M0805_007141 [Coniferiporia weirii]